MPADTRSRLLDAAADSLGVHGFAGTSIRDLARAVGIKESSVYKHFPSKQAILEAVLARADERLDAVAAGFGVPFDDLDAAAAVYGSITVDRLEEIAAAFLTLWLHDRDLIAARRVLTLEQFRSPDAGRRLSELLVGRPIAIQTPLFAALIERAVFRPADPTATAFAFWGPVLAILLDTTAPDDEHTARERLRLHLTHFRTTHLRSHP